MFVDLCGGPGGFTRTPPFPTSNCRRKQRVEYIQWRLEHAGKQAVGIGMTLRAGAGVERGALGYSPELRTYDPLEESFYITYGKDGTGRYPLSPLKMAKAR